MKGERVLEFYNCENPFQLTLKAYESRPKSEKRYAVVLAHNSAKHVWDYLVSIWDAIDEEMSKFDKSTYELIRSGIDNEKLKNYLTSSESRKRLRLTPVYTSSIYIFARIFLDRSAVIYPVLTSYYGMPKKARESLPEQYHWLKENKSEDNLPYFQILEKHWSDLNEKIIRPRNKLITHALISTEQFRMGGKITPKIRYEKFSLEDESFVLKLIEKYKVIIEEEIPYPKQEIPNTINKLIEKGDKLDSTELTKLTNLKDKMVEELPTIETTMKSVDSFRLDLDKHYSSLIDKGILS